MGLGSAGGVLKVQDQVGPEPEVALADVLPLRFFYQRLESREALEEVGYSGWSRRGWPYQLDRYDVSLVTDELRQEFARRGHPVTLA